MIINRRVSIFTGGFGSGKTEVALNYAVKLRENVSKVTVVDLDLVNPYFRTRTAINALERRGINVISPSGKLAGADVPALPPAIQGVLEKNEGPGIFDVGGNDIGAAVLRRFKKDLPDSTYTLFMVVNVCRIFTRDTEGIIDVLKRIESMSGLRVDALISNTNLGPETDKGIILKGHQIILEAAGQLGLPVPFMAVRRDLAGDLGEVGVPVLKLDLFLKLPWDIYEGDTGLI